ncbi:Hypothetical predicted protein [Mytilus galloprovincialis]|nr:Hypothetical predicted protein [Mytilus galloprovincialis]
MTECKTITTCPLNELCIIESNDRNGEIYFNSGCQTKYACDMVAGTGNIFGKREINGLRPGYGKRCCAGDLCNTEFSIDLKTTSSVTTTKTTTSVTTKKTSIEVTTPETTVKRLNCEDHSTCGYLVSKLGVCDDQHGIDICPVSCGRCIPTTTMTSQCTDTSTECDYLNRTFSICQDSDTVKNSGCKKTCDYCDLCDTKNPCNNNGVCIKDGDWFKCKCLYSYYGSYCEQQNSDSYGIIFHLAFLASFHTPPAYVQLYIITNQNGTCMIRIPYLHINTSVPVTFDSISEYRINSSILMTTQGIQHKAILVSCDVPVSIYGMNYANVVTEGYLGIPQNGLGSKYIVSSFSHDMSEFGIIAPSNDTVISINLRLKSGDLKYNGHTYRPGNLLNITMFKDETFYLSSTNDLSGTIISSTKHVAVVSGVKLSFMNDEYSNHMTEMILPHKHLGRNFIVPVLYNSQCKYRIFADSPSSITIQQGNNTKSDIKHLTVGQYLEVTNYKPTTIRSSTGILVQLYCDSNGLSYDSVMVTLPAVQHFKAEYQFVVVSDFPPGYQPNNYYMTVIIPTHAVFGLKYDGYLLVSFIQKSSIVMSGQTYSILIKEISRSGLHTLTQVNNVTFGLIINGKTTHQGYAYPAGFQFNNGAP